MTARILDGQPVARELQIRAREELQVCLGRFKRLPRLYVIRVGQDESSIAYEHSIRRAGSRVGIDVEPVHLAETAAPAQLAETLEWLNRNDDATGVIVLQPLPDHFSRFSVADVLDPIKDVDGITTYNAGRLFHGDRDVLAPSTPAGGMALLKHYEIEIEGRHAVVVGRSSVVGKPMAMMLLVENATVAVCHSKTRDLDGICRTADILVGAAGHARLIGPAAVKPGATVIDFGVNIEGDRMVGDVDFDAVRTVAGALTPVPGGTGRVTTMVLVRNTIKAMALQQQSLACANVEDTLDPKRECDQ